MLATLRRCVLATPPPTTIVQVLPRGGVSSTVLSVGASVRRFGPVIRPCQRARTTCNARPLFRSAHARSRAGASTRTTATTSTTRTSTSSSSTTTTTTAFPSAFSLSSSSVRHFSGTRVSSADIPFSRQSWPNKYHAMHKDSIENPESFWGRAAQGIDWYKKPTTILDKSGAPHFYRWFSDGELNVCYNALDRHVITGDRGEQVALRYVSPVTNTERSYTYSEMLDSVQKTAGFLRELGVQKGDRVVIYMPMIPEATFAMLACARLGAVHSVVFGGFAAEELAVRIDDVTPKVVMTASCGVEGMSKVVLYKPLLDRAIEMCAHKPGKCIVLQRNVKGAERAEMNTRLDKTVRDYDWATLQSLSTPMRSCVSVKATDPLYVLYTSGTTGAPKGVVRDSGSYAVALHWSMKNVYGVDPGDTFWGISDIGWVVGHSYIVYAPLLHGNTTVLFEGKPVGTPDASIYWKIISDYGVKSIFTAPTAMRAIRKEDPQGELIKKYDMSEFKYMFVAGERADPNTVSWCQSHVNRPIIDHYWQTESGWPMVSNFPALGEIYPTKLGSSTFPVPGYEFHVLDDDGKRVPANTMGALYVKLPLPPGMFPTLWNNDQRFIDSYLTRQPGYYETGDAGFFDSDGYLSIMTRTDDVINVAGHRFSTGHLEEVIAAHTDVSECAVIGVHDDMKGEVPLAFVVLNKDVTKTDKDLSDEIVALIRAKVGAVASLHVACVTRQLPKTRSGKILRSTMKKIADGEAYKVPATIEDTGALSIVQDSLRRVGYPPARSDASIE